MQRGAWPLGRTLNTEWFVASEKVRGLGWAGLPGLVAHTPLVASHRARERGWSCAPARWQHAGQHPRPISFCHPPSHPAFQPALNLTQYMEALPRQASDKPVRINPFSKTINMHSVTY